MSTETQKFDDTDPAIAYSQGWGRFGSGSEYNTTTTLSVKAEETATLAFKGSSVSVYGTTPAIGNVLASASYSIDDDIRIIQTSPKVTANVYQSLFFQSPTLPEANHTLVITTLAEGAYYWLDFITVTRAIHPTNSSVGFPPSPTPSSSQSTTLSIASASAPAVSATTTPTPSPPPKQPNTLAITAGVLGAVIVILLVSSIGAYLLRKWNKRILLQKWIEGLPVHFEHSTTGATGFCSATQSRHHGRECITPFIDSSRDNLPMAAHLTKVMPGSEPILTSGTTPTQRSTPHGHDQEPLDSPPEYFQRG
ncbi:unnamed protein product [Cyclocybe aegerita]|uniref:Uncharacterized protein n=1 Tax=Cyclocybe aegerita TaxID=1973307 RepID=A0A8S0VUB8_CYCAE|nr:unnamed protein product [Cyclocybe aegerita]